MAFKIQGAADSAPFLMAHFVDLPYLCFMTKHELIPCDRCGTRIECKANGSAECQCHAVRLDLNEMQYISELFEGCLCVACLSQLQAEYVENLH
jgi:hypothetical protein